MLLLDNGPCIKQDRPYFMDSLALLQAATYVALPSKASAPVQDLILREGKSDIRKKSGCHGNVPCQA